MRRNRVHWFLRHPREGVYSVERLFAALEPELRKQADLTIKVNPFRSSGIVRRLASILWARCMSGAVNHITGDEYFLALLLPRRGLVLTVLDFNHFEASRGFRKWLLMLLWAKLPVLRAPVVTAISQETKDQVVRVTGCDPAKVHVVPCPLTTGGLVPHDRSDVRQALRIIQVGTKPNKNLYCVAHALAGTDWSLTVVGRVGPSDRAALIECQVAFTELQGLSDSALLDELAAADVLVFVSTAEGFGLPILEAQAVGTLVVTSDLEPMRTVAGGGAVLVDPSSPIELRAALRQLSEDTALQARIRERGFENVKAYDPAKIVEAYSRLYALAQQ